MYMYINLQFTCFVYEVRLITLQGLNACKWLIVFKATGFSDPQRSLSISSQRIQARSMELTLRV